MYKSTWRPESTGHRQITPWNHALRRSIIQISLASKAFFRTLRGEHRNKTGGRLAFLIAIAQNPHGYWALAVARRKALPYWLLAYRSNMR